MPCAWGWRRAAQPSWQAGCGAAKWRGRRRPPRGCWIKEATSARRAALELLEAVRGGATFAAARDRHLAGLAERDRRLAHELAAGVLRRRAQLDRTLPLSTADPRLHDILRLGAYQLRALDRVPAYAAVSTSVALARETAGAAAAGGVSQALRKLARSGGGERGAVPSHPSWLVQRWKSHFGEADAAQLIAWNDRKPILTLQPARWDQETLARRLRE